MKWIVAMLMILPALALGQANSVLTLKQELESFAKADGASVPNSSKLEKLIEAATDKRESFKKEEDFVESLFLRIHQRFLKVYKPTAAFHQLFDNGAYNCLTATALYYTVFSHFGFETEIYETEYHIFMLVAVDDKQILIETTDHLNGFVTDADAIAEKIKGYQLNNTLVASASKQENFYKASIFNKVQPAHLPGLIHFNASVHAYNDRAYEKSVDELVLAHSIYPSQRLHDFSQVLMAALVESDLQSSDLHRLVSKLQAIHATPAMAMNAASR